MVIYIFQSTGLGPVSMLVESRACWKMFLFHRVGRRKGRRCSTFLDACGCGIYASSTISANRFTPTDRGKSVSLALPAYLLAWKYSRFHLNFPPTFNPLYLSLSFSLCFNESHLRSSRINRGRLAWIIKCVYTVIFCQKWIFNLDRQFRLFLIERYFDFW